MGLTRDLFSIPKFWTSLAADVHGISGRDLIMLVGGLFLIGKATYELHDKLEGDAPHERTAGSSSFATVIVQIVLIDIVFSLDSVITAVGMVSASVEARWIGLSIMITAVVISVGVMLAFAGAISRFVAVHPTLNVLALSLLILIGVMLVAEGLGAHFPKGYVYFAMAFSLLVELMNMRLRKVSKPVTLQQSYVRGEPVGGNVYQSGAEAFGPKQQSG
jgi:predicted tellurium resistance membrane protein TerC